MRIVFEKRASISRRAAVLVPVVSFVVSLIFGAILLAVSGANPFVTYAAMVKGAFGSWYGITETLVKAIPLMLTGLAVSVAFRMRFWNIGAEGQLTLGGVAAAGVALYWSQGLPGWTVLPLAILAGIIAGALWAGIPAVLKAYLKVDETLTTLAQLRRLLYSEHLTHRSARRAAGRPNWWPGAAVAGRANAVFRLFLPSCCGCPNNPWGSKKNIGENQTAARYLGINIAEARAGAAALRR